MRGRRGRLAKLLSVPVLAACGFAAAATLAGAGLATEGTSTSTSTSSTTTTTTTTTTPPGGEGCTPGFWKNHPEAWEGYTTAQTVGSVFSAAPASVAGLTLLDALKNGGGEEEALARHAVAALLGAASSNVDFPIADPQDVIDLVNDAFASGDYESAKDLLEGFNELDTPGFCD
jgi:hypothetical protein